MTKTTTEMNGFNVEFTYNENNVITTVKIENSKLMLDIPTAYDRILTEGNFNPDTIEKVVREYTSKLEKENLVYGKTYIGSDGKEYKIIKGDLCSFAQDKAGKNYTLHKIDNESRFFGNIVKPTAPNISLEESIEYGYNWFYFYADGNEFQHPVTITPAQIVEKDEEEVEMTDEEYARLFMSSKEFALETIREAFSTDTVGEMIDALMLGINEIYSKEQQRELNPMVANMMAWELMCRQGEGIVDRDGIFDGLYDNAMEAFEISDEDEPHFRVKFSCNLELAQAKLNSICVANPQ